MLLVNFTTVAGCAMFVIFPAYLEHCGLSRTQIGLADGCFWSVSLLVQPLLGPKLDRYGPKPFILLGTALMATMAGLFYACPVHPLVVMAMRGCQGAGFATYLTSGWTWVAGHVDTKRRGEFFGYFGFTSLIAGIVGPAVGERVGDNYQQAFLVAALALLCATFLAMALPSAHAPSDEHGGEGSLNFLGLLGLTEMRSTALASLGYGLTIGSVFAFAAAYLRQLHLHGITLTFAFIILASAVARFLTGRLSDSHGPVFVILPSLFLLAGGCLGLAALPYGAGGVFLLLCLAGLSAGLGYGAIYPALNSLAVARLPERAKGRGLSLVTASIDLGNTAGAALAGVIADSMGYSRMFLVIGLGVLATSGCFLWAERLHDNLAGR
jgi:MFS family permease